MKMSKLPNEQFKSLRSKLLFSTKPNLNYVPATLGLSFFLVIGLRNFFHPIADATQLGLTIFLGAIILLLLFALFIVLKCMFLQRIRVCESGLMIADILLNREYYFPYQSVVSVRTDELNLGRAGKYNYMEIQLAPECTIRSKNRIRIFLIGGTQLSALSKAIVAAAPSDWETTVAPGRTSFQNTKASGLNLIFGPGKRLSIGWFLFDFLFLGFVVLLFSIAKSFA